ncbi:lactonase family protein [Aureivirga marina]|uniref:hypothetical protein n=1 Tax=Aureivirga marina TaxID=1182451 RepID=UPI0018CAEC3E|nr:hypothetical protein [Aureivirga marina]
MKTINYYLVLLTIILSFSACVDKETLPTIEEEAVGFLYTTTNSSNGNEIVAMGRNRHGALTELKDSPYSTGANGDAIRGDFDSQEAMMLVGDFLLVVNAGGNPLNGSISVFKVNKYNGTLEQVDQNPATSTVDNCDSKGVRPVSLAHTFDSGKLWVIVANQYANPSYTGNPPVQNGTVENTNLRNLAVFELDQSTGILSYNNTDIVYNDGNYGGPSAIAFNSTGTKLAVTTWGVPHFEVAEPDPALQQPSRVYFYDFSGGMLSQTAYFEEEGISGSIGCSWSPNDAYLYVANFNLTADKEANSLTVLGTDASKAQNFATGDRNDEACWTYVGNNQLNLFVSSFGENIVSSFEIDQMTGLVSKTLNPNFWGRRGNVPPGDTKDMYEFYDNRLYVSGALKTHEISIYHVRGDGKLHEIKHSPFVIPSSRNRSSYDNAFLGLIGFERKK